MRESNGQSELQFFSDDESLTFNLRERRALKGLDIHSVEDFVNCDLSRIFELFYIGEATYNSLVCKQEELIADRSENNSPERMQKSQFNDLTRTDNLYTVGLNPSEIQALESLAIRTIGDFLHCIPERLGNCRGIGRVKIKKLKKLQKDLQEYFSQQSPITNLPQWNPLDDSITNFPWKTRELNALNLTGIETLRDLLLFDMTVFTTLKRIGKKTYAGLIEKQNALYAQFKELLVVEKKPEEVSFENTTSLPLKIFDFLTGLGMSSLQEFFYTNFRVLQRSISDLDLRKELELFRKSVKPPVPVTIPMYLIWEKEVTEPFISLLPFFSGHFNKGFDSNRFHSSYFAQVPLNEIPFDKKFRSITDSVGLDNLGALLLTSRTCFTTLLGRSTALLTDAQNSIRNFLLNNTDRHFEPDWSTPQAFADSLINCTTQTFRKNERWTQLNIDKTRQNSVLSGRADGMTLDEIGQRFNITRERIRQIEQSLWRCLATISTRLEPIRSTLCQRLTEFGGFVKIDRLCEEAARNINWPLQCVKYYIVHFLTIFSKDIKVYNEEYAALANFKCPECPRFLDRLDIRLQDWAKKREFFGLEQLIKILNAEFFSRCPNGKDCSYRKKIPMDFYIWLFESNPRFIPYRRKKVIRMNPKLGLFESIAMALKKAARPLTKKEILIEIRKINPNLEITEKQIKTTAGNSLRYTKEILLWNRGGLNTESMYVYQDYVRTDAPVLEKIEKELTVRSRRSKVPQMRLNRIFSEFRAECTAQGIPNVYALFACLKNRNNPSFAFQRSPYIGFVGHSQKQSNATLLEDYVRCKGGSISGNELRQYGQTLGLRDEHIQNTIALTKLIVAQDGYVLLDRFDPASKTFQDLLSDIAATLNTSEYITAAELFVRHRILCEELHINDARMFYHLLKKYASDRFTFSFPAISLGQKIGFDKLKKKVIHRISLYIRSQRHPISSKDLIQTFCTELGFSLSSVYAVILGPNVLLYNNASYIHTASLRFNRVKRAAFYELIRQYWQKQQQQGRPFGSILEFLESNRNNLPELSRRFSWNRFLIYSLLLKDPKFVFLGNSRNIFALKDKGKTLPTFGSVLRFILVNEFNGRASLQQFERYLAKDIKMIRRDLSPFMSAEYPGIRIDGQVIESVPLSET